MNIRELIDNYVECNTFEIKFKKRKLYVYYYDNINHFSSDKIELISNKDVFTVLGKKLIIEELYKELLVISGEISNIKIDTSNE